MQRGSVLSNFFIEQGEAAMSETKTPIAERFRSNWDDTTIVLDAYETIKQVETELAAAREGLEQGKELNRVNYEAANALMAERDSLRARVAELEAVLTRISKGAPNYGSSRDYGCGHDFASSYLSEIAKSAMAKKGKV